MLTWKPFEKSELVVDRNEASFDRACDAAYHMALLRFGCDEDGHLNRVLDSERATDSIEIVFIGYHRTNHSHTYTFETWIERNKEE